MISKISKIKTIDIQNMFIFCFTEMKSSCITKPNHYNIEVKLILQRQEESTKNILKYSRTSYKKSKKYMVLTTFNQYTMTWSIDS